MAPGSPYSWLESKQALFHWIVERGAEDGPVQTPKQLPIRAPSRSAARRQLTQQLDAAFARARRPMSVIERSALDAPELFELYFARLAQYIARRQRAGTFRAGVDPRVAARFPEALPLDDAAVRDDVVKLVTAVLVAEEGTG